MSSSVDPYRAKKFAELDILCQDLMGMYWQDLYKPAQMTQTASVSNFTSLRPQLSSTTIQRTMQESAELSSHVSCKLLKVEKAFGDDENICDTSMLDEDLQQEVENYCAHEQLTMSECDLDALIDALSASESTNERRIILPHLSRASSKGIKKVASRSKAAGKIIHHVPDYSFLRRRGNVSEKISENACSERNQN